MLNGHIDISIWMLTQALLLNPYDLVEQTPLHVAAKNSNEHLFEDDSLIHGPNAAWVWSNDQKVSILYFQVEKQVLRDWAYVMWDVDMLKDWGILDVQPPEASRC